MRSRIIPAIRAGLLTLLGVESPCRDVEVECMPDDCPWFEEGMHHDHRWDRIPDLCALDQRDLPEMEDGEAPEWCRMRLGPAQVRLVKEDRRDW